ncbi:hypothetical protein EXD76_01165 [BEV proteobacterium]|nr:hypothetical protein [Candidatus Symbiopectobacterium sp. Chty_BC]
MAEVINIHPAEIWPSRYYDPKSNMLIYSKKTYQT